MPLVPGPATARIIKVENVDYCTALSHSIVIPSSSSFIIMNKLQNAVPARVGAAAKKKKKPKKNNNP